MWKWIKNKFKRKNNFSGFKVEVYRDGKLIIIQRSGPTQTINFNSCGPMILDGAFVYGYTLTPHLSNSRL